MPEWLPWLWLAPTILFSFVGQGTASFLLFRLVYNKWFKQPDSKDLFIQFLTQKTEELAADKARLVTENGELILSIMRRTVPNE